MNVKRKIELQQKLSVLLAMFIFAALPILTMTTIICIALTEYYYVSLFYLMAILFQIKNPDLGIAWKWARNWKFWRYVRDYYPVKLIKTCELDPGRNYLFCGFPHGIFNTGGCMCFATDALGFGELFPGMTSRLVVLDQIFWCPVVRDIARWLGMCPSSSKSIDFQLDTQNGVGRCVVLMVGGTSEVAISKPGVYNIVLQNRRGFIKKAIKYGSPLVPVFNFGENDLFDIQLIEGSITRRIQKWFRKYAGPYVVIFSGAGLYQDHFPILPKRIPVTVVVGKPLEVPKIANPTQQDVDLIHAQFTDSIKQLFNQEKGKYLLDERAELIIN